MNDEPQVSRVKLISPVWFIPLLALAIAGWLALKAWQETGPVIEIEFSDGAGIEVGKTHVRYRDIEIGKVTAVTLSDDFKSVRVTAQMAAYVEPLINDRSNFWVVSPRVSRSGISGIETLLSGVYIEMDSGGDGRGESRRSFVGLEEPPSVRSYDKGTSYQLLSDTLGSLDIGSPIYHRQVPVGEVTGYRLLPDEGKVQIRFFVKAPYNLLVKENSQFWNISGLRADIGLNGVELDVASLSALVAGGVEFDTPVEGEQSAAPGRAFYLFADREAVHEGAITVSYPFMLHFSGSVRGLKAGAPVEYMGIQVGQVEDVALNYTQQNGRDVNVLIVIQPERMYHGDVPTQQQVLTMLEGLVKEGMQARLSSGSLLGGALFVDLVPKAGKPGRIRLAEGEGEYPELPTAENEYAQIARQLATIVSRAEGIPLEQIGNDLQGSLKELRAVVAQLNRADLAGKTGKVLDNLKRATDGLDGTVQQLEKTLRAVDQTVAPDSALSHTLIEALEDVSDAARSMEQLTDELYRYPDALLRGKEADPQ